MLFSSLSDQDKCPLVENLLTYINIYTVWIPTGAGFGQCLFCELVALKLEHFPSDILHQNYNMIKMQ